MDTSLLIIAFITGITALIGNLWVVSGMNWYASLKLPSYTPPNWVFSLMWTLIYLCTAAAAYRIWHYEQHNIYVWIIIGLFITNACLNIYWTYLFFHQHALVGALIDALLLLFNVLALMYMIGSTSYITAALLIPYAVWMVVAIVLNTAIVIMNR